MKIKKITDLAADFLRRHGRLLCFCGVGALNTAVDFIVYSLAVGVFRLPAEYSQAAGYSAGLINSYILNRTLTFKTGSTVKTGVQLYRFVLVNAATLCISIGLISLLTGNAGINEYVAKIPVTAVVMLLNYFGYKLFVFGVKK
jgi:putative flippase GtrA